MLLGRSKCRYCYSLGLRQQISGQPQKDTSAFLCFVVQILVGFGKEISADHWSDLADLLVVILLLELYRKGSLRAFSLEK